MRIPKLLVLTAVAAIGWAAPAAALEAPHDGATLGTCDTCHLMHGGGGTLMKYSTNNIACLDCHKTNKLPGSKYFATDWVADDQAVPGSVGVHHNFSASATNATHGAVPPASTTWLVGGTNLQCSTCHDPHGGPYTDSKGNAGQAPYVSIGAGAAPGNAIGNLTLTVSLNTTPVNAASPKGYAVKVVRVVGTTFELEISNDYKMGATAHWLEHNGTNWVAATAANGTLWSKAATIYLNDGTNAWIVVGGGTVDATDVGAVWEFYVGYPFLRYANAADANGMCLQCHKSREMSHLCVEGTGNDALNNPCAAGTREYSHPVSEPLGAKAGIGDLTPTTMLDANGSTQVGGTDTNKTNDMLLGVGVDGIANTADDVVGCLSCHAPHNTDSNSLSVDAR